MLQYSFLIHFIFILYISVLVNNGHAQENGSAEPFPKEKCESMLHNCSCYELTEMAAIVCKNRTDFTNFNQILKSGDIFVMNITYELTFSGVKYIPSRIIEDLIVNRFIVDDPDTTFDEDIFEGVIDLYRLHVRQSSIKVVPNFGMVKHSMMKINIDSSHLTSLEGKNLQNLSLVNKLSFSNNSIRFIAPDVFKGTDNILILDLSYNLLTSLPPKLLDPMTKLLRFVVSNNNLLHVDGLFSVTHPQFIYLDFNNISDADSVLVHNMKKVTTFALASNPIKKVSQFSFNGKIPNVKFLYLDHCELRDFKVSHYRALANLASLDLSYNLIEEVTNQEINIGYALELDFTGNQIRKFDAEIKPSVKRLYLNGNRLKSLNTALQNTQMEEVQVAGNQIEYLTEQDLHAVHSTNNLEFQENKIRRIDTRTFEPLQNHLHYLDLSYNFITSLNGSLRYLSQLKLLNLTHNLIQTFEKNEFTGLNELSELYLQHNQIKALGQLQYLERLQYLVITHNDVELITPDQVPRKLRFMYLADNPLKCDCRFQPFLLWLNESNSVLTDIELCQQVDAVSNSHDRLQCPSMCSCGCTHYGNIYFMSVDCSSRNLSVVPKFLRNDFMTIDDNITTPSDYSYPLLMDQNIYPSLHIEDQVLGVNLENNILESLEEVQLPPNLTQLFLSNNKLRLLPDSILNNLQNLKQASLSENPWDCDCNALRFKKWLTSKYDVVQDIKETFCGTNSKGRTDLDGMILADLTDLDICPEDIGLIVSVSFSILILLLLGAAAKILYMRYELHVKVFLYSHGFTWVKEEDLDSDKIFDAFISFSHKDDFFVVKEIITVIERNTDARLCIHCRDFLAGKPISDNIVWAVENSKRTVIILTKNFLESEWCLMEFRTAHTQALEDKVHRIIVVKLGDLPKEIDSTIKVYLDSTTYLTWGEKYFWEKLFYVLPNSGASIETIPRNIKSHKNRKESNVV